MVITFRIIDSFVESVHKIMVSMAAIVGLFLFPPIGILLLLYLRGMMTYDRA